MDGWLFAVAALVAILGIELAVFWYFATDGGTGETTLGSNEVVAAGTERSGTTRSIEAGAGDELSARECHDCGTPNGDVSTFLFCRRCLARIH